jgi:hypothetical protein
MYVLIYKIIMLYEKIISIDVSFTNLLLKLFLCCLVSFHDLA